jgi:uncharacterized protein with GYD domain
MADYVGLLKFNDGPRTGEEQLAVDAMVKEIVRTGDVELEGSKVGVAGLGGGTLIGVFWTEGEADMMFILHARDEARAVATYNKLAEKTNSTVRVFPVYTEAQKERAVAGDGQGMLDEVA